MPPYILPGKDTHMPPPPYITKKVDNMNNNRVAENPRLLAPSVKFGAGNVVLSAAAASVGSNVAASGVCQM